MKARGIVPMAVLSQQLKEAIDGRHVRVAVFTTFSFDPGFFELHILPLLFDQPFSQVDKVRRIQLEDALRSVDHLAVYYDRRSLSQDCEPAQLDYRRIDVRRKTGCFHLKLAFLLVDQEAGKDDPVLKDTEGQTVFQSLIVAVTSANLTRAGYWENIECAHIEEIPDRAFQPGRCSFRRDLLALVQRIFASARADEDHSALTRVHRFLRDRAEREQPAYASVRGQYFTRLFCGQGGSSLSGWLKGLRLGRHEWNLEILSPYFDSRGPGPLADLIDTLQPKETRVYLPRDADGAALVTRKCYESIAQRAAWADLPTDITQRGRSASTEALLPRAVHAKVYRMWNWRDKRELLIMGSVNLTSAAHGHSGMGNLEAAFLVDVSENGYAKRWWLSPLDAAAERFTDLQPGEEDGLEKAVFEVSFRYDWAAHSLSYRLEKDGAAGFAACETNGYALFRIDAPLVDGWVDCGREPADKVREMLKSSSFLLLRHEKGAWRILVREDNMGHRPSLVTQLTPGEILEYWSLLTPEQRAAFLESRAGQMETLEGLQLTTREEIASRTTLFDRFAGVYHAFGCLRRHVEAAVEEGREAEAETRLLGAKYDSLPVLLEKTLAAKNFDPVIRYVTFLCARQVRDAVASKHPSFFVTRENRTARLEELLAKLPEVRVQVPSPGEDGDAFFEWYEDIFLREP